MKKVVFFGVVCLGLVVGAAVTTKADPDPKIFVCHFDGHDKDFAVGKPTPLCEDKLGGNLIEVSCHAAGGHNVKAICETKEEAEK